MEDIRHEIEGNPSAPALAKGSFRRFFFSMKGLIALSGFDLFILILMTITLSLLVRSLGSTIRWLHPSMGLPVAILTSILLIELLKWLYFRIVKASTRARHFLYQIPEILRDWTPFILVVFIYENLHDLSGNLTNYNIAEYLHHFDVALFGVEPTLWMQKIAHPWLTDLMAIFYAPYLAYPLILMGIFSLAGRRHDFQNVSMALILTFVIGFICYAAFPCNPPRFHLEGAFTDPVKLSGSFIYFHLQGVLDEHTAVRGAAMPSLHTAISSVALYFAFRYRNYSKLLKTIFYVYVPLIIGLWVATVYLRHHWIPDILAGWAVALLSIVISKKLLAIQNKWRSDLGVETFSEKPAWIQSKH